jgi:hypothetical protein
MLLPTPAREALAAQSILKKKQLLERPPTGVMAVP